MSPVSAIHPLAVPPAHNPPQTPIPSFLGEMSVSELDARHKPYRQYKNPEAEGWIEKLDLEQSTVGSLMKDGLAQPGDDGHAPRILLLYGSLRPRSFSRLLCFEFGMYFDFRRVGGSLGRD